MVKMGLLHTVRLLNVEVLVCLLVLLSLLAGTVLVGLCHLIATSLRWLSSASFASPSEAADVVTSFSPPNA
jgi:hypothetical protein